MRARHVAAMLVAGAALGGLTGLTRADAQTPGTSGPIRHVDVDGDGTVEWCSGAGDSDSFPIQDAPYYCEAARDFRVQGANFTISMQATFNADGTGSVIFTLSRPGATQTLPRDVPVTVSTHAGISSTGPLLGEFSGVIAAGALTTTVNFTYACGQNDIRAVFDNTNGRLGGPYVCWAPPPSTVPDTAPTTAPGSTVPGTTSPGSSASSTPTSGPGASVVTLPATGGKGDGPLAYLAVVAMLAGATVIVLSRRRAEA